MLCVQFMPFMLVRIKALGHSVFNAVFRQNVCSLHSCSIFTLVAELNSVHIAPIPPCTRVDRADLLTVHSRRGVAPGGSDFKPTPADFASAHNSHNFPFRPFQVSTAPGRLSGCGEAVKPEGSGIQQPRWHTADCHQTIPGTAVPLS